MCTLACGNVFVNACALCKLLGVILIVIHLTRHSLLNYPNWLLSTEFYHFSSAYYVQDPAKQACTISFISFRHGGTQYCEEDSFQYRKYIRIVTCNNIHCDQLHRIMNTLYDRLHIPWKGSAKQIICDSFLPIILQPLLAYIAAQNVLCTVLIFIVLHMLLWYACRIYVKKHPRTRSFFVWILTSLVLLVFLFEVSVVPLLEILPEENVAFVLLVISAMFCTYRAWTRSVMNHVTYNDSREDRHASRNKAGEMVCSMCRKRIPPRTYHCNVCQTCILKKEYHCVWLNCCIGEKNHCVFVLALLLSFGAFSYGAILTLTSVCHPFFFFMEFLLLPDDCSDVYHDLQIAVCFVSALYSLALALMLLLLLSRHCWLISLGLTGQEWEDLQGEDRKYFGLRSTRPYSKGFLRNWISCIFCRTSVNNE